MHRLISYLLAITIFVVLASYQVNQITLMKAQERIQLTVPDVAPTINNLRLSNFRFEEDNPSTPADEGMMTMEFVGVEREGNPIRCTYNATTNPTGTFLIVNLQKANLSTAYAGNATTGSLKQRIHHRLVVMNERLQVCPNLPTGSLTGLPQ